MSRPVELRAFHAIVAVLLLIPSCAGLIGAFGGIEGLAWLFGVERPVAIATALRSSIRAICLMFAGYGPIVVWSLRSLEQRAGVFRIVCVCGFGAGLARLTSLQVDGNPGALPLTIMGIELGVMPLLLLWHARLLRSTGEA